MSRISRRTWIILIATGVLTAAAALLGNIGASALNWLSPQVALLLFLLVSAAIIALDLWKTHIESPAQSASAVQQHNREQMLDRVHRKWIVEYLEDDLRYDEELLPLPLRRLIAGRWDLTIQHLDVPTQSVPAGTRITEVYDQARGGELLILGDPGCGKTTLLLELTCDLLERARKESTLPIPVVFTLSSWAEKRPSIEEWLVDELSTKYQVQRQIGKDWVENHQLLLLLDGLDEVAPAYQAACVEALNEYRRSHREPMVVSSRKEEYLNLSSSLHLRTAVFVQPLTAQQIHTYLEGFGEEVATLQVALRKSESLQHLAATPFLLKVLILTYHGLPIRELLTLTTSPSQQRDQLFEQYVHRMLEHRGTHTDYAQRRSAAWLRWLAKQLTRRSQTEFYLEQMQPDWFHPSEGRLMRIYNILAIRLPGILLGVLTSLMVNTLYVGSIDSLGTTGNLVYGLIGGLLGGLLSGKEIPRQSAGGRGRSWGNSGLGTFIKGIMYAVCIGVGIALSFGLQSEYYLWLHDGLVFGLSFGVASLLLSVIVDRMKTEPPQVEAATGGSRNSWRHLVKAGHLIFGLWTGLIIGLSFAVSSGLQHAQWNGLNYGVSYAMIDGLRFGLSYGLIGVLLSVIIRGRNRTIQPTEIITWSWSSLRRNLINAQHLRNTLIISGSLGLFLWLSVGLSSWLNYRTYFGPLVDLPGSLSYSAGFALSRGLSIGLTYWLLLGLFMGISSKMLDNRYRTAPNQGIRRSADYGFLIGVVSGLISGFICLLSTITGFILLYGLLYKLAVGPPAWLSAGLQDGFYFGRHDGLIVGIAAGLLAALLMGWLAFFQHGVLRLLLWHTGSIPRNYPSFLDYAAECNLLRKVGGGYLFRHRLIQDFFASETSPPASAPGSLSSADK